MQQSANQAAGLGANRCIDKRALGNVWQRRHDSEVAFRDRPIGSLASTVNVAVATIWPVAELLSEELNFTRAAEQLRLAQPSLTRQIHNLEDELGVRLLDRTKNQVLLTQEGKSFLVDAKRLVTLSLESIKSVQRASRGESGQLNLGYLFKFNFDLLLSTLSKFYQTNPEISVNLFDMSPAEQLRSLEARKIDLGFVGFRPPPTHKNMASLVWQRIARHEVVVVLPARQKT